MTQRTKPPQKTAVVWTDPNSKDGIKAAAILRRAGAKVEVREVGSKNWNKASAAAANVDTTKLPQVVVDDVIVGDLAAVKSHKDFGAKLSKPKLSHADRKTKAVENRAAAKNTRAQAVAARVLAEKSVVLGRQNHQTAEQQAAATARAAAAKTARAEQLQARVARINAARG